VLQRFRELATGSERRLMFGSEPRGPVGLVALCVWVVFLVFPLGNAIGHHEAGLPYALSIVGAGAFVVAYGAIVIVFRMRWSTRWAPLLYVLVVLISIALSVFDRPGWGFLFTYCAAGAAMIPPARYTLLSLMGLTVLAGCAPALGGADGGTAIGFVASTAGIGLLMMLLRDLRARNDELTEARAELARLAVAEERERFARDMHDLLGHTLSVIALKAELAGRLVGSRPEDAAREIAEVERVARGALGEVRDAVSGYRQPTLSDELAGARMALSAAGVSVEVNALDVALDPGVEAVLAWAVREGATNVIRHSGASRCSVSLAVGLTDASVEVADDGRGAGVSSSGHGLAGLRERAEALGGRVDAGACAGGGFRLRVQVPVVAAPVGGGAGSLPLSSAPAPALGP
jgi:two-component system, NarL family, sensor histidine kinase DesK